MVVHNEVAALRARCVEYGPTPDGVEDVGLVQLAAAYGYADMLALLLEFRTDPRADAATRAFDAPLRLVCGTSATPPDPPAQTGHAAPQEGAAPRVRDYTAVARMLVAAGADVHCCDGHGRTPLHCTALDGGFEVASLLVEQGARLGDVDCTGRTAMHLAALQANVPMVLLLLACGADLTAQDNTGSTPVDLAVQHQLAPRVCKLLQHRRVPGAGRAR